MGMRSDGGDYRRTGMSAVPTFPVPNTGSDEEDRCNYGKFVTRKMYKKYYEKGCYLGNKLSSVSIAPPSSRKTTEDYNSKGESNEDPEKMQSMCRSGRSRAKGSHHTTQAKPSRAFS